MDEIQKEYFRRTGLLEKISRNSELKHLELKLCKEDKIHFINNWGMTYDPRRSPKHFPFTLYDYQIDLIKWLDERFNKKEFGLIEKSRDLGATWVVCAWAVHKFIYENGFSCLFGSRKEDLVDDKTINSIFGKMRYLIYRLPKFLRPILQSESKADSYMRLINPENGNELIGESTNRNFGRGGRSSICFLDEFAFVEKSENIWASISDNSDCVITLSTPNGKGNEFARLRHETDISVKSLHWTMHPLKSREWYEERKKTMLPWQIAQELDLSYEKSLSNKVYEKFDRQWHISKEVIKFNPEYEQWVTWDFGLADPTAILWGQITTEGIIQVYQCFELSGEDIDFFIPIARGYTPNTFKLLDEKTKELINKVLTKIPQQHIAKHYGDHGGTAKTANSKRSCKDALKESGIDLITSGYQIFDRRIKAVENILKLKHNHSRDEWYSILEVSPDCTRFIDCMNNYRWDSEDKNKEGLKPKHDEFSHMVTAFEFFILNRFPPRHTSHYRELKVR